MLWRHVVIKSDNHPGLIVYKLNTFGRIEFNTFAWNFLMLKQNLKVKCSAKSGRIVAYKNTQAFSQLENKRFKAFVFWLNDNRFTGTWRLFEVTAL